MVKLGRESECYVIIEDTLEGRICLIARSDLRRSDRWRVI
jgi:hypothetical protein